MYLYNKQTVHFFVFCLFYFIFVGEHGALEQYTLASRTRVIDNILLCKRKRDYDLFDFTVLYIYKCNGWLDFYDK